MCENVEGARPLVDACPVRKCRFNLNMYAKRSSDMMPRIWLAAILGVLLGGAVAYTTAMPISSQSNTKLPPTPFQAQLRATEPAGPVQSNSQLLLISLLAAFALAAPIFLVTKKRT